MARIIDSMIMNAFVIAPMKLDKSRPAALKDLPVVVWSKLFSIPSFSTILFTAFPTTIPTAYPISIIIIAATMAGIAFAMFAAMSLKSCTKSTN